MTEKKATKQEIKDQLDQLQEKHKSLANLVTSDSRMISNMARRIAEVQSLNKRIRACQIKEVLDISNRVLTGNHKERDDKKKKDGNCCNIL
jgi:hypothetical protein